MPNILERRLSYKPVEYPQAEELFIKDKYNHWLWNEVDNIIGGDKQDWEKNLDPQDKSLVGGILKGFAQTECLVGNYWTRASMWFPKPEVEALCISLAEDETRHAKAYNYLNEILELEEFDAFLQEPEVAERLSNLIVMKEGTPADMARSLAIFSAFCEGVCLFSAFAILLNFSRRGMMNGTCKIIEWSSRDEQLHSSSGIWLFRTLLSENPHLNTPALKADIEEAARVTIQLEDNYLDYVFKGGDVKGLTKYDLKQFVRFRANNKLKELGYDPVFEVDLKASRNVSSWFEEKTELAIESDFFATTEASYTKRTLEFTDIDW